MKELTGGLWLAALIAGAMGMIWGALVFGVIGGIAAAGSWYAEVATKKQAASWRKNYPSYKY